jgi:hypothetical protein
MTRIAATLAIVLLLAGCAGARERQQARLNAQDDVQCRNMGAVPGTDSYLQCREFVADQRARRDAQINANMATLGFVGLAMQQQSNPRPYAMTTCQPMVGSPGGLSCITTQP